MSETLEERLKAARKRPAFAPGPEAREVTLERRAIERLLPHREPFAFVDRISVVDLARGRLRAHRSIDPRDPVFRGHFPDHPVYPGVLLLETMGQAGICLIHLVRGATAEVTADTAPLDVRAFKVHSALFLAEVGPGAALTIDVELFSDEGMTAICLGQLRTHDEIAAIAAMEVFFVDQR